MLELSLLLVFVVVPRSHLSRSRSAHFLPSPLLAHSWRLFSTAGPSRLLELTHASHCSRPSLPWQTLGAQVTHLVRQAFSRKSCFSVFLTSTPGDSCLQGSWGAPAQGLLTFLLLYKISVILPQPHTWQWGQLSSGYPRLTSNPQQSIAFLLKRYKFLESKHQIFFSRRPSITIWMQLYSFLRILFILGKHWNRFTRDDEGRDLEICYVKESRFVCN